MDADENAERAPAPPEDRATRRRRFRREVGSVVLGVLIALGIGEIADAIRWQVRIHRSFAAMRTELSGNRFNLVERQQVQPCIVRRLDGVDRLLAAARVSGRLPATAPLGALPWRPIERAAFDVAVAEGIMLHMDRGDARDIALAYDSIVDSYARLTAEEQAAWTDLSLIANAPGPIDGDTLLALRQASARARGTAGMIDMLARESTRWFERFDVPVEYGPLGSVAGLASASRARPICAPLRILPSG